MTTSILWFKNNLRLQDNEVIIKAIEQSDTIIPIYCFDETHFGNSKFGTRKTSNYRTQFLLETLKDLDNNLRAIGSGLMILKGKPEIEILKIAESFNAKKVFAQTEIGTEEKETEKRVEASLQTIDCYLHTFNVSTLFDENNLPFSINNLPDIFSNFRRQVEKDSQVNNFFQKPIKIVSPIIPDLQLPTLASFNLQNIEDDNRKALDFKGGESNANRRLSYYFYETKCISKYKETRNGLIGADYSSKFSAWLANGSISAGSIYFELKEYEKLHGENESTYWLIFELIWRDYFYFVMKKYGNKLFLKNGIKDKINDSPFFEKDFNKWKTGQTGVDFVDANMIELNQTGFMSNRGRQNVASYLCNDLNIDWRYGAAYFEEQLIDYDVSSNWGNWAYLAGVGNDPRPNRYLNIQKQANDYDFNKTYRKLWLKN